VTGPDGYTTVVDNNLFTNLMASENLQLAAHYVDRARAESLADYRHLVNRTGETDEEVNIWRLDRLVGSPADSPHEPPRVGRVVPFTQGGDAADWAFLGDFGSACRP
jgi:hypothetical protein